MVCYSNLRNKGGLKMTKFDKEYLNLCKKILTEGMEVENRTGINTIKIPSYQFEFDLSSEFPILQSKQTLHRQAVIEMLWIWQMQSNKVSDLHERNVHIWDEWRVDDDGIYRIYEPKVPGREYVYEPDKEVVVMDPLSVPVSDPFGYRHEMQPKCDEFGEVMTAKSLIPGKTIKTAKYYGKEFADTIGTAYGFIANRYQMTQNMEYIIKNDPNQRRGVNNLFQNEFLRTAVLPPCVYGNRWVVTGDTLNLLVEQRSCDVPLGLPFNVTQYATFLRMMAQVTGKEAGKLFYNISDAHIYMDQVDKIKEQLERWDLYQRMLSWDKVDLIKRQLELSDLYEKLKLFLDGNDDRLMKLDSELRIIDMVLNPKTPELWLNPDVTSFFDFDNSAELKDVKILNYKHMGKLKFPIAQ